MVDHALSALKVSFDQQFTSHFSDPSAFPTSDPAALHGFSKDITSSLIGGVGYFYGTSIVDKKSGFEWDDDDDDVGDDDDESMKGAHLTEPKALLTATPSRSFFPRGFYWYDSVYCCSRWH
jgi:mannosyl-oligosaccharide glucosidase